MAFDLPIGAMTIYCEASGELNEAKLGVAWSMINRLMDPGKRYGATIAEICLRRYQYSEWNDDKADNANLLRAAKCAEIDLVMQDCIEIMGYAIHDQRADPTGNATHYYDVSISPPFWTAPPAIKTCQIGKLIFYKDVP